MINFLKIDLNDSNGLNNEEILMPKIQSFINLLDGIKMNIKLKLSQVLFIQLIQSADISLGQTASHSRLLLH